MANQKILEKKAAVVANATNDIKNAKSFVVFEYQGLTVADIMDLRKKLREENCELKVYKNTLASRALKDLNIDLGDNMNGQNAFIFGQDEIAGLKVLAKFQKDHQNVNPSVGYITGKVVDQAQLAEYAKIPDKQTLLTMFAGGIMQHVRNMAIGLDLYAKKLEESK